MKQLKYQWRINRTKAPTIYVMSAKTKELYGSFSTTDTNSFKDWDKLNNDEMLELKLYMQNIEVINNLFGKEGLDRISRLTVLLPEQASNAIEKIYELCVDQGVSIDIYETLITSVIQTLKVTVAKLQGDSKKAALKQLEVLGQVQYTKIDYSSQMQAIFAELLSVPDREDKLESMTTKLFNKHKRLSPIAIEAIAKGEENTSKWICACAIQVLANNKPDIIGKMLTEADIFGLWLKPLLDNGYKIDAAIIQQFPLTSSALLGTAKRYIEQTGPSK